MCLLRKNGRISAHFDGKTADNFAIFLGCKTRHSPAICKPFARNPINLAVVVLKRGLLNFDLSLSIIRSLHLTA